MHLLEESLFLMYAPALSCRLRWLLCSKGMSVPAELVFKLFGALNSDTEGVKHRNAHQSHTISA